jgi:hypothetical protein
MTEKPEHSDHPAYELKLSDPDLKKRVLECIEKHGKLSIFLHKKGSSGGKGENGYTRVD